MASVNAGRADAPLRGSCTAGVVGIDAQVRGWWASSPSEDTRIPPGGHRWASPDETRIAQRATGRPTTRWDGAAGALY